MKYICSMSILLSCTMTSLYTHGFSALTSIKSPTAWSMEQICRYHQEERQYILGYDFQTKQCVAKPIASVGISTTDWYVRICFEKEYFIDDIICTPTQEFYMPATHAWVPAYKLRVGDELQSGCHGRKAVTYLEYVKKQITVYAFEVKDTHTFFVGRHSILTHNFALPWMITLGISVPFGTAVGGAGIGAFFGPPTIMAGIIIGGFLGCMAKFCCKNEPQKYAAQLCTPTILDHWGRNGLCHMEETNGDKIQKDWVPRDAKHTHVTENGGVKTDHYEKDGEFEEAFGDFQNTNPVEIEAIPAGFRGTLADGTKINVRSKSKEGRVTLEIQHTDDTKSKVRYKL